VQRCRSTGISGQPTAINALKGVYADSAATFFNFAKRFVLPAAGWDVMLKQIELIHGPTSPIALIGPLGHKVRAKLD
jgi:hypothetical protein